MGVNGGAPLVPENDGQGGAAAQKLPPWPRPFPPGGPGCRPYFWGSQNQLLGAVLLRQGEYLVCDNLGTVGVDGGGESGEKAGGIRDGDAVWASP